MAVACLNIAAAHMAQQHFAAAADGCSHALQLQPDSVKGLVRRARCYSRMHEYAVSASMQACNPQQAHVGPGSPPEIHAMGDVTADGSSGPCKSVRAGPQQ
jgi:hypothetical protein